MVNNARLRVVGVGGEETDKEINFPLYVIQSFWIMYCV